MRDSSSNVLLYISFVSRVMDDLHVGCLAVVVDG